MQHSLSRLARRAYASMMGPMRPSRCGGTVRTHAVETPSKPASLWDSTSNLRPFTTVTHPSETSTSAPAPTNEMLDALENVMGPLSSTPLVSSVTCHHAARFALPAFSQGLPQLNGHCALNTYSTWPLSNNPSWPPFFSVSRAPPGPSQSDCDVAAMEQHALLSWSLCMPNSCKIQLLCRSHSPYIKAHEARQHTSFSTGAQARGPQPTVPHINLHQLSLRAL